MDREARVSLRVVEEPVPGTGLQADEAPVEARSAPVRSAPVRRRPGLPGRSLPEVLERIRRDALGPGGVAEAARWLRDAEVPAGGE